ncbi:MAG TPA: ABC transporter permease subunit [Mobilitalea sp.]|nr:ABC transporter permease subunit [Mobilitalea sp.]
MKGYIAFTKKEIMEQLRTFRVLIMLSVFFLFGMMSPLLAKLTPDIISGMEMQGITIIAPPATVMDAFAQFFKNITSTGFVAVLLVFGGVLSNELTKGTLINMLAKGLKRRTVILAKYSAALMLWTISYILACLVNQVYTVYLFDVSGVNNLLISLFCLWLFGAFLLALIILSSTLTGGNFGGLILTAVVIIGLMILNIFPKIERLNPVYLSSHNSELLTGSLSPNELILPVCITVILIIGCIYASILLFGKKKL